MPNPLLMIKVNYLDPSSNKSSVGYEDFSEQGEKKTKKPQTQYMTRMKFSARIRPVLIKL